MYDDKVSGLMKLTKRLQAVLDIVPYAGVIADVGTDHGYLAAALIETKKAASVIAIDVNKGPLESAKNYIASIGYQAYVECRLSNGLQKTKLGELTGAVICGMGGFLMRDIIAEGPELLSFYVLQPQNGQGQLRQYMVDQGYRIVKDIIMTDMGKFYQAFLAIKIDLLLPESDEMPLNMAAEGLQDLDPDAYQDLPKDSILWTLGATIDHDSDLWTAHVDHFIRQQEAILKGMTPALKDDPKYKEAEVMIQQLQAVR